MISRRLFFAGAAASVIASPAIVRAASLMPVRALAPDAFAACVRFMEEKNALLRMEMIYASADMPIEYLAIPVDTWRKFKQGIPYD
jgi:hypothetical protein